MPRVVAYPVVVVACSVEKIARHNDPVQTKPAQGAAAGELEPYLSLDDAVNLLSNLAESLHRSGINIRMLGLVRWHCKLAISKSLLLAEMVARAARKEVRHVLRTASKASSMPTFTALNRYAEVIHATLARTSSLNGVCLWLLVAPGRQPTTSTACLAQAASACALSSLLPVSPTCATARSTGHTTCRIACPCSSRCRSQRLSCKAVG